MFSSGALVLGCGGSEHATPDAGVCAAASDCDDGVFCTGEEACSPLSAEADARGCVPGAAPCAGANQTCSEATEECITECDPTAMDEDSDGYDSVACGGADCDDTDANRFPATSSTAT